MQQFKNALVQANNLFRTADHLAYVSYPLLKDNKLLVVITKNLYMAGVNGMDTILYYEKVYKRINILPTDFNSRMLIFEKQLVPRMKINSSICKIIKDLRFIINQHRESPVEFSRKDKFVICNDDYSMVKTIDLEILKSYIVIMREFLHFVNGLKKDV